VRIYLREGLRVGLGTDVAGGSSLSVSQAMVQSIQASKLRWRYVDDSLEPLTAIEAFYLATRGGGSFWGQVGSFEPGFEFDAVVLDDSSLCGVREQTPAERLEQLIYSNADLYVSEKYVRGTQVCLAVGAVIDRPDPVLTPGAH
jgi:guanine deaminase